MNKKDVARKLARSISVSLATTLVAITFSGRVAQAADEPEMEAMFQEGMAALESDRLRRAIEVFNSILSSDPKLHRARLELALAYYRSFSFDDAERLAQEVLDDPNTPENVRVTVLAFLAQVRKDGEKSANPHTWHPNASLGFLYDSNVNVGPSGEIVEIDGQSLLLSPGSSERGDNALEMSFGLSHTYRMGKTMDVSERVASMLWQTQASLYHRDYFDFHAYNLSVVNVSTGPALVVPKHLRASLQLMADHIVLGSEDLALFTSLRPLVTWQFDRTELTWDAIFTDRSYKEDADAGREGEYWRTGLSLGQYYKQRQVAVQGGVNALQFNADSAQYAYNGYELFIGASARTWPRGNAYGRITFRDVEYDAGTVFGAVTSAARDEEETRLLLGVDQKLKGGWLADWSMGLSAEYTDTSSNVSLYDYDRMKVSFDLSRTF